MNGYLAAKLLNGLERYGYGYAFDDVNLYCCHNLFSETASQYMRVPAEDLNPIQTKEQLIEFIEVQWAIHNVCGVSDV